MIPPLDGIFHNIVAAIFRDISRYFPIFPDLRPSMFNFDFELNSLAHGEWLDAEGTI